MKPGDLLYTVYEDDVARGANKLVIRTAEIVSAGPKVVRISGGGRNRAGLAFGCRSQLPYSKIDQYGTSAAEAWAKYVDRCTTLIDWGERELVRLRRNYHEAVAQERATEKR